MPLIRKWACGARLIDSYNRGSHGLLGKRDSEETNRGLNSAAQVT